MRIFLSIKIPEAIKRELVWVQEDLKKELGNGNIRWEDPSKLHITLIFIGAIPDPRVEEVEKAVRMSTKSMMPVRLRVSEIAGFPSGQYPRVLVIDMEDIGGGYAKLQKNVVEKLTALGFDHFLPKPPHITLARVREGSVDSGKFPLVGDWSFEVRAVVIKKSELGSMGAVHTPLATVFLGGCR